MSGSFLRTVLIYPLDQPSISSLFRVVLFIYYFFSSAFFLALFKASSSTPKSSYLQRSLTIRNDISSKTDTSDRFRIPLSPASFLLCFFCAPTPPAPINESPRMPIPMYIKKPKTSTAFEGENSDLHFKCCTT